MMLVGFQGEVIASVLPTTLFQFVLIIRKIPASLDSGHHYSLWNNVTDYLKRVISALVFELIFTAFVLYLITKYMNLPLHRLWKKTWKEKSLFAFFTALYFFIYVGYSITSIALRQNTKSKGFPALNCNISRYIFW